MYSQKISSMDCIILHLKCCKQERTYCLYYFKYNCLQTDVYNISWIFLMEELHSLIMINFLLLNATYPKLKMFFVWLLLCFVLLLRNQPGNPSLFSLKHVLQICVVFFITESHYENVLQLKKWRVIKLAFSSARCRSVIKLIEDWQLFKNILKCICIGSQSFLL